MALNLTVKFVKSVNRPGRYGDGRGGNGLTLVVTDNETKQWVQRIWFDGKQLSVGLGGYPTVTLNQARKMALKNRRRVLKGNPPKSHRERLGLRVRRRRTFNNGNAPTFRRAVEDAIKDLAPGWKNADTMARAWRQSLAKHAYPHLGDMSVADITDGDVLAVILPIWTTKRSMANAVLRRICRILRRAKVQGHRQAAIATEDVLAALPTNGHKTKHHASLPHGEVGKAMAAIAASTELPSARLAMRFLILTAARSAEVTEARWEEIDLGNAVWVRPASRMKGKVDHRVPLSRQAVAVLEKAKAFGDTGLVFPSKRGKVISGDTMRTIAKRFKVTVHGFRTGFRVWASETGVGRDVAEACLAHKEANQTVAAYARSELLEARQAVMQQWADYLAR